MKDLAIGFALCLAGVFIFGWLAMMVLFLLGCLVWVIVDYRR